MIRLAACLLLPLVAGSNLSCSPVDQWEPVCFLGASIERSPPQTYANWHAMWCEQGAASHGQWSIGECVSDAAAAPAGATATDEEDSSLQRRVLHDDTDDDHGEEDDHEDDGGEHEADDKHSGDAGGHSAEGHDEAHGSHQYALLYFAFLAIVMGCATECVLNRHFPKVPYTVALFAEGIFLAILHHATSFGLGAVSDSMHMWLHIDPHVLLYSFLPVLLFGDAMALNMHVLYQKIWQTLLLAGPGMLLGALAMGVVAKGFLPYDWPWHLCITFGSICAATDPVAVVSLLNSLGASKGLTMAITGESLFNDGSAVILFTLFFDLHLRGLGSVFSNSGIDEFQFDQVLYFIFKMLVGSPLVGAGFGAMALWALKISSAHAADRSEESSATTWQIAITLCTAYLSFYCAESLFHLSGVLSCVCAALFLSAYAWPFINTHHGMHRVWHTFEFLGNTLIFVLAGALVGEVCLENDGVITWVDYFLLIMLWLFAIALRAGMIALLWPLLKRLEGENGFGALGPNDGVVMVWGGLRGAVGLALAIIVDEELHDHGLVEQAAGKRVLFHVGGLAFLTLFVNGSSTSALLARLGMTAPSSATQHLEPHIKAEMARACVAEYEKMSSLSVRFNLLLKLADYPAVLRADVGKYCSSLRHAERMIAAEQTQYSTSERIVSITNAIHQSRLNLNKSKKTLSVKDADLDTFAGVNPMQGDPEDRPGNPMHEGAPEAPQLGRGHVHVGPQMKADLLVMQRSVLVRCVRIAYWEMIEKRFLPTGSAASRALLGSCDISEDSLHKPLALWSGIEHLCLSPFYKEWYLAKAARKFSRCTASTFTGRFQFIADHLDPYAVEQRQRDEAQKQSLFALVAFIEATEEAMEQVKHFFGATPIDGIEAEMQEQLDAATDVLVRMDPILVRALSAQAIASVVLEGQFEKMKKMIHSGLISEKEGDEYLEELSAEVDHLSYSRAHAHDVATELRRASLPQGHGLGEGYTPNPAPPPPRHHQPAPSSSVPPKPPPPGPKPKPASPANRKLPPVPPAADDDVYGGGDDSAAATAARKGASTRMSSGRRSSRAVVASTRDAVAEDDGAAAGGASPPPSWA